MNKQLKRIIVMVVAFVVLTVCYISITAYNKKEEAKNLMPEMDTIVSCDLNSITEYSVEIDGVKMDMVLGEDNVWYLSNYPDKDAKQYICNTQRRILSEVKYKSVIENVTDISEYGLDNPKIIIRYRANGADRVINVGDYNITSEIFYLGVPEEPDKVYIANSTLYDNFNKTFSEIATDKAIE